eukprot:Rmarinus@m.18391
MGGTRMRMNAVLGTMGMGGKMNPTEALECMKLFSLAGYSEVDTALLYHDGLSEATCADCFEHPELSNWNYTVATKANPWRPETLSAEGVKAQLAISLGFLRRKHVDVFYLHAPDHNHDICDTLAAVNDLHKEGKFTELGISNYAAWQVMEIYHICKEKGYVLPTVYQGMYNAVTRDVERELLPCIRRLNMRFYAYNPLAGGILSGVHKFTDSPRDGRFSGQTEWGQKYRARFWNRNIFDCVEDLRTACQEAEISLVDASYRWLVHHSLLNAQRGDAVILGGSSIEQIKTNIQAMQGDPLPDTILQIFDNGWDMFASHSPSYFR